MGLAASLTAGLIFPLSAEGPVCCCFCGERWPRHDAVGSVMRTRGLQQHRDWFSALAEPYTTMVAHGSWVVTYDSEADGQKIRKTLPLYLQVST
eukprot:scaffold62365_cov44-Cyclotella_meneghiniana.AAC.4